MPTIEAEYVPTELLQLNEEDAERVGNSISPDEERAMGFMRYYDLGVVALEGGREVPIARTHVGPEYQPDGAQSIAKGGLRAAPDVLGLSKELAATMKGKCDVWGLDGFIGGKGLISVIPRSLTQADINVIMHTYAQRMYDAGIIECDVPAPDMDTNGAWMKPYALGVHELLPDNPNWLASITGKDLDFGGVDGRVEATGFAAAEHTIYWNELQGAYSSAPNRVKIMGFGNAGAWYAHYISQNEHFKVNAISDADGVLYDEDGLNITEEMAILIGDDKSLGGRKMTLLLEAIRRENPHSKARIIPTDGSTAVLDSIEAEFYAPASLKKVVNVNNVHNINVTRGIVEVGNETTTPEAHAIAVKELKLAIIHDALANGGGVSVSIVEWFHNLKYPGVLNLNVDKDAVLKSTAERTRSAANRVYRASDEWDIRYDYRRVARILHVAGVLHANGVKVNDNVAKLIEFEGMPDIEKDFSLPSAA